MSGSDEYTPDLQPKPAPSKKEQLKAKNPTWTDAELEAEVQEWEAQEAEASGGFWRLAAMMEAAGRLGWKGSLAIIGGVLTLAIGGILLLGLLLDGGDDAADDAPTTTLETGVAVGDVAGTPSGEPAVDPTPSTEVDPSPTSTTTTSLPDPPPSTDVLVPTAGAWAVQNYEDPSCPLGSDSTDQGTVEVFEGGERIVASGLEGGATIELARVSATPDEAVYAGTLSMGVVMQFTFTFDDPGHFEARGEAPGMGCFLAEGSLESPAGG